MRRARERGPVQASGSRARTESYTEKKAGDQSGVEKTGISWDTACRRGKFQTVNYKQNRVELFYWVQECGGQGVWRLFKGTVMLGLTGRVVHSAELYY